MPLKKPSKAMTRIYYRAIGLTGNPDIRDCDWRPLRDDLRNFLLAPPIEIQLSTPNELLELCG